MNRGDEVRVFGEGGSVITFTVRSVGRWPKAGLPPELYAPTSESRVVLVSCRLSLLRVATPTLESRAVLVLDRYRATS